MSYWIGHLYFEGEKKCIQCVYYIIFILYYINETRYVLQQALNIYFVRRRYTK